MSKGQDSKDESVQQSGEAIEKPGKSQDTPDLVDVKIIEKHRQSVLVEYEVDGMPYRATVDANDLVDDKCPRERLGDAPYGITWEFDFDLDVISHDTEFELKRNGIWTYADLVINDRQINRIASILLSRAIWKAAKRGCNRRP